LYRYAFAILVPVAMMIMAYGIRLKLPHNPVLFAITAVIVVSWHAGFGPGLVAALTTTAAIRVLFVPNAPLIPSFAELLRLGLFFGLTALISVLSTARRKAEQELREANANLDELVRRRTDQLQEANQALQAEIKERSEAQAELERSNQFKDEFLALVGHELRNPLAVIANGLEVLQLQPEPDSRARIETLMSHQVRQLVRIVDDLVDMERISRGKIRLNREPLSVRETLEMAGVAGQPMMREKSHEFLVRAPDPDFYVDADPVRLEQAIANLLTNAARYTPRGGRIELSARSSGDECLICCKDNGVGLSPDMLESIFEPFVQYRSDEHSATPGLGLGLNLVKRLVEMHGGDVKVESAGLGSGSKFTLRLPVLHRPQTAVGEGVPAPSRAKAAG
jgi:signal transduction histidine kinase